MLGFCASEGWPGSHLSCATNMILLVHKIQSTKDLSITCRLEGEKLRLYDNW